MPKLSGVSVSRWLIHWERMDLYFTNQCQQWVSSALAAFKFIQHSHPSELHWVIWVIASRAGLCAHLASASLLFAKKCGW